jgi:hypothetical protein
VSKVANSTAFWLLVIILMAMTSVASTITVAAGRVRPADLCGVTCDTNFQCASDINCGVCVGTKCGHTL